MADDREQYPEHEDRERENPAELATAEPQPVEPAQAPAGQGEETPYGTETQPGTEAAAAPEQFDFMGLVYGALFNPWRTFGAVAKKPPVGLALLILAVVLVCSTFYGMLEMDPNSLDLSSEFGVDPLGLGGGADAGAAWSALVLVIMFIYFVMLFAYSGYLHLAGEFLGGRGSAKGVYVAVCLSQLPYVVAIPVMVLAPVFGGLGVLLMGLANLGVAIWSIVIQVIGLVRVMQLSTRRAVLAVFSPILLVLLFVILLVFCLAIVGISAA